MEEQSSDHESREGEIIKEVRREKEAKYNDYWFLVHISVTDLWTMAAPTAAAVG